MRPSYVTLEQMLDARERRAGIQYDMLKGAGSGDCLVCLTLNIAGEVKRTPMTKMLFDRGIRDLESLGFEILRHEALDEPTGSEAFYLLHEDAARVKSLLEAEEDAFPAARLFDFDVLDPDFKKLSRAVPRHCLICGRPAAECARSRNHGLDQIKAATDKLLRGFCADTLGEAAYDALLDELYTTPKPGLVDRMSCGAHKDMDIPLFEKSAKSLRLYFRDAALLGMAHCGMKELRERGAAGEKAMFEATGGVNTHKGMVYSMGLLLAGMGMTLTVSEAQSRDDKDADVSIDETDRGSGAGNAYEAAIANAAALAGEDAAQQLEKSRTAPSTNGGAVLRDYGANGATGEAAAGFPHAVYCAERLGDYKRQGEDNPGALAFCDSMASLEDTNLLHRGGKEGLTFAKETAAKIAALPTGERIPALGQMDAVMIERNLSPGGSADMLALAFLLDRWLAISKELYL